MFHSIRAVVVLSLWLAIGGLCRADDAAAAPRAVTDFSQLAAQTGALLDQVDQLPDGERIRGAQARAAAVRLYRLQALPAAERYERLRAWTLPDESRKFVRTFAAFLPDYPPPTVFLAEPLPAVVDPLVSLPWLLVDAAREADRLDELAAEVGPLVDQHVDGADWLMQLTELARGNPLELRLVIAKMVVDQVRGRQNPFGQYDGTRLIQDGLLIKAALSDPETRDLGRELLPLLQQRVKRRAEFEMVVWAYRLGALGVIADTPGCTLKPSSDPGLKHWIATDIMPASGITRFGARSWWLALDDRVAHVSSPWIDQLVFAYPLTGDFDFSCECYNGFWTEANVGYNGLIFEPWNQGGGSQVYPVSRHEAVGAPEPRERREWFNPTAIHVSPERLSVTGQAGQVLFEDPDPSPNTPFLMLQTTWLTAHRRLQIKGSPVIPRRVSLLADFRMEGWVTSFYDESQPRTLTTRGQPAGAVNPQDYDWSVDAGELHGRRIAREQTAALPYQHGESWCYFHRPLREGDRIEYEFLYTTGDAPCLVHPTLDRLAFLMQRDGVKLHWLTANRTADDADGWIATDNAVAEPASRRGPDKLPLREFEWNRAAVSIHEGQVRIELNGELVCERPLEAEWGTRFGFYHDRTETSAQVRNVVLSGDWPEWSPELAEHLLERSEPLSAANEQAIRDILGERLTSTND